jgi:alanine racemase
MNMRAIATISQSALLHNLSVVKKYAPQAKVVAMAVMHHTMAIQI